MAVVGRVARPHGIRGQFFVHPDTDFPEDRFGVGARLFAMRDGCIEPDMFVDVPLVARHLDSGRIRKPQFVGIAADAQRG